MTKKGKFYACSNVLNRMYKQDKLGSLTIDARSRTLNFLNNEESLRIIVGNQLPDHTELKIDVSTEEKTVFKCSEEETTITISYQRDEADVYTISWDGCTTHNKKRTWPTDVLDLSGGHWYGGPELLKQHWPLTEECSVPLQPYVTKDMVSHQDPVYGSFAERYFLNSKGFSIVVDESTPLWVGINENNDRKLRLCGQYCDSIFPQTDKQASILKYDVIVGENVKVVHQFSMKKYFSRPISIPDERMFRYPIWSTWARYKQDICQENVLNFAKEINEHNFPNSQLEIDDMWSSGYGDQSFDVAKFPDPKGMVDKLHEMNFRVTLWTTPFFNVESETLRVILDHRWIRDGPDPPEKVSFFVKAESGTPALIKWWNGYGTMIDFTNRKAGEWFISQHKQLQHHLSIDSFKFDAGEAEFLPSVAGIKEKAMGANLFTRAYVECASKFGGMVEVRSGYKTQHLPVFVRMMDKFSTWSHTNGLRSLIPTCLTLSMSGYHFILPDMIGGNVYFGNGLPSKELYIRWVEISAFMPAMQFSVVPWQYDDESVVRITKKYVDIHASYVTRIILKFAHLSTVEDGNPIIRPIWWLNPNDSTTFTIDDEFLIGDEVLVAPVVHEGMTTRNIYLPGNGGWRWKDESTGKIYASSQWLNDYDVPLDEVAYFSAVKPH